MGCSSVFWLARPGYHRNTVQTHFLLSMLAAGFINFCSLLVFLYLLPRDAPVSLSLCRFIYYEWADLLSMPVVHVMSEVCHSGLGWQHMAKRHSLTVPHTLPTSMQPRAWRAHIQLECTCQPLPWVILNNSCLQSLSQTHSHSLKFKHKCTKCVSHCGWLIRFLIFPFECTHTH